MTTTLCVLLPALCVTLTAPSPTTAGQLVSLKVGFSPDRLSASTTINVGFDVKTPTGQPPSPLVGISMNMPKGVNLSTTSLGLAVCHPAPLEADGPEGCSPNAVMGHGTALVEVPIGPEIIHEWANVTILMGPAIDHHTTLIYYADGRTPVSAQVVFNGLLLPGSGPFGGLLNTTIPLVPSLPGAPDAAVVYVRTTFGPAGLRYYKHQHGRTVAYKPEGIEVPSTCPAGGFPFAATFSFQDGSNASANAAVPCPSAAGSARSGRRGRR
ncbi:MAG TPA: hypothetical protein VGY76_10275 [Solirubrobacteraceae bacterium]|jgi:hypothetical protein|nr:hypothetical protein [Solirubrobacteraceae bacterium]